MTAGPPAFVDRYGPWAVVAGAGAGLGAAYVDELVDRGLKVIAIDIDPLALDTLQGRYSPGTVEPVVADLGLASDCDRIVSVTTARDVGLLICNAALSYVGRFMDQPLDSMLRQLDVNLRSTVMLLHGMLPALADRDRAGVVLMSSLSCRRGAPLVATYAATKAYLAELAESLWDELAEDDIDVLAVLPGSTRTPGWLSSLPQPSIGTEGVMEAVDVVIEALDCLGTGEPMLIAGEANRASDEFMGSLPRAESIRMVGQVMRDTYPADRTQQRFR